MSQTPNLFCYVYRVPGRVSLGSIHNHQKNDNNNSNNNGVLPDTSISDDSEFPDLKVDKKRSLIDDFYPPSQMRVSKPLVDAEPEPGSKPSPDLSDH